MEHVALNTKSDLKVTNVCLSDVIRSTQENSRVTLIQGSESVCVSLLEPFQVCALHVGNWELASYAVPSSPTRGSWTFSSKQGWV